MPVPVQVVDSEPLPELSESRKVIDSLLESLKDRFELHFDELSPSRRSLGPYYDLSYHEALLERTLIAMLQIDAREAPEAIVVFLEGVGDESEKAHPLPVDHDPAEQLEDPARKWILTLLGHWWRVRDSSRH